MDVALLRTRALLTHGRHLRRPTEKHVTDERVGEVCSTIGNLIRIALAVDLEEVRTACATAAVSSLDTLLLDPLQEPQSAADDARNRRLLEIFMQFRVQLQFAGADFHFDEALPP